MVGIFVLARVLQILGAILGAAVLSLAFSGRIGKPDDEGEREEKNKEKSKQQNPGMPCAAGICRNRTRSGLYLHRMNIKIKKLRIFHKNIDKIIKNAYDISNEGGESTQC